MAAQCLGSFGSHKWRYHQYLKEKYYQNLPKDREGDEGIHGFSKETVWVNKRYIPTDLRSTAPVARHKLMTPDQLPQAEKHWVPDGEQSLRSISRASEETCIYRSQPSTRSEQWSTLRQMLPSYGTPIRKGPPNWGTGMALPPVVTPKKQSRFPHINSPMTKYTDDMHLTNRLFRLH
ncbi:uncharacterized protein LOC117099953 [Anneissia japonica]|uniref:uncharacterized protein LOC117099953 n=1 Tax=Anneissia japonica TaxID=1529436 RepID=UPI00142554C0|nr:uncharacterized protein LOC117099953 [Anneissia japonica]